MYTYKISSYFSLPCIFALTLAQNRALGICPHSENQTSNCLQIPW